MRLPNIKKILREDMKDAPAGNWLSVLINPINSMMEYVYISFNKNITFEENIRSQQKRLTFKTSADYVDIQGEIDHINEEIENIQEEIENISGTPVGHIMLWSSLITIPVGYVLSNGQILSKTSYPDLYDVVGDTYNTGGEGPDEFRVPNYQGLVPRGWGSQSVNGRTKDGGVLGTVLEDQIQSHAHIQEYNASDNNTLETRNGGEPVTSANRRWAFRETGNSSGYAPKTSPPIGARTGTETRASSLSTVFLIKAFNASLATATQEAIDMLNGEVEDVKSDVSLLQRRYLVHFAQSGSDWQEVYNDGWVRQARYRVSGGSSSAHNEIIPFNIAMKDTNYTVYTSYITSTSTSNFYGYEVPGSRTTSNLQIRSWNGHAINYTVEGWGDSSVVTALGASPAY